MMTAVLKCVVIKITMHNAFLVSFPGSMDKAQVMPFRLADFTLFKNVSVHSNFPKSHVCSSAVEI